MPTGEKQRIELTADNGNDGSKVSGSFSAATMNLFWEEGDVITVSGGATGMLTLDSGAGTSQGHFSGEIEIGSGELVFTWTKVTREGKGEGPNFNNQAGTQDWIIGNLVLEAKAAYNESGKYSLKMEMPYAVLKLNLSALVGTQNDVKIKAAGNAVATVKNLAKANSAAVFVAMHAAENQTYTFSGNFKSAQKEWALEANTFYTAEPDGGAILLEALPAPGGAIDGVFSVGSGKQVYFSQGNLQYMAKGGIGGDATQNATSGQNVGGTWRFAENQWDVIGKASMNASYTYTNWIDVFCWATSGFNHNNKCYRPWNHRDDDDSDYYINSVISNDLNVGNGDWGANPIYAGDAATPTTGWRTLSIAEWKYLLSERTMVNGKPRYAYITSGHTGLIIFPDNYSGEVPTSLTTIPEGCVFLPKVGDFQGSSWYDGSYYWSSTPNEWGADCILISNNPIMSNAVHRYLGCSVRLVKDIAE